MYLCASEFSQIQNAWVLERQNPKTLFREGSEVLLSLLSSLNCKVLGFLLG